MIESPPALRTAGEIHASRQQRRLELGRSEHIAQEMAQYGLQARKLLWQQVSQRTPGLIRLSVDHIGQARIQTLLQQVVFGIEGLMQIESVGLQCGMRKRDRKSTRLNSSH